jgi:hypothetical protein
MRIIEEIQYIQYAPAINSLQHDPHGPLLIEVLNQTTLHAQPPNFDLEVSHPIETICVPSVNTMSLHKSNGLCSGAVWDLDDENSADKANEDHDVGIDDEGSDDEEHSDEDDGEDDNGSEDGEENARNRSWKSHQPPSIDAARQALADLNLILKPPCPKGGGFKECRLPLQLRTRLEWIAGFLYVYVDDKSKYGKGSNNARWIASSLHCAHAQQSNPHQAKNLRKWAKAFIKDRDALPVSKNGTPRNSQIDDQDIAAEIAIHLQSLGPYVRALDIVHYVAIPEVKKRLGIKKTISVATAQRWMKKMGYRWTKKPSGQYMDGHERDDVVYYHQSVFLPAWAELDHHTRQWTVDNVEIVNDALASG